MASIRIQNQQHTEVSFDPAALEQALGRHILAPGTAAYEEARQVWNGMIDRHPGLIVQPRSELEVQQAVRFASEHQLLVSVRGGGHNIAGSAVLDGGLVIDCRHLDHTLVDAGERVLKAGPGATLGDIDQATQAHGLLLPMGINSTTGIAGLTLGGGFGWTSRRYGLTIDNLERARIVTADGQLRTIDSTNDAELFWAIRGGGGNFGVVTEFQFALNSAGPDVISGMLVHPFEQLHEVIPAYQQALDAAPETLTCWVVIRKAPPLPFVPEAWHGRRVVVLALCSVDTSDDGGRSIEPFRSIGEPIAEAIGQQPFTDWQQAFDPLLTEGARNYWKSHDVASFDSKLLDIVQAAIEKLPTDECEVFFGHVGGAATRVEPEATAWPNREAHFVVNVHTRWRDPADDQRCRDWARQLHSDMAPHAMGSIYLNFIPDGDEDQARLAFGDNYARLQSTKREYDPGNLFRANISVQP